MTGIKTSIGWCSHTDNAITGCLGPGNRPCPYCWARIFRQRLAGVPGTIQHALAHAGLSIHAPTLSRRRLSGLELDLGRARQPRRVFFSSMGDLGYDGLYHEMLGIGWVRRDALGGAMVRQLARDVFMRHPRHTFLILSKQPHGLLDIDWPANVHVGVSLSTSSPLEAQRVADLRGVTCGLRWASVEPLLDERFDPRVLAGLDWVVIGAQTGSGAPDPADYGAAARRIAKWCGQRGVGWYAKHNTRAALGL